MWIGFPKEGGEVEEGRLWQRGGYSCGAGSEGAGRWGAFCLRVTLQEWHIVWGPRCRALHESSSSQWARRLNEKPSKRNPHGCGCNSLLHIRYLSFEPCLFSSLPLWTDQNGTPFLLPPFPHPYSFLSPLSNPLCLSPSVGSSPSCPPHKLCSDRPGCESLARVQMIFSVWEGESCTGSVVHRRDVCC